MLQLICPQADIVAQDTIPVTTRKKFVADPMKATMLAVVFPGLGQIYNKKYFKVPFVYAGFGGLAYLITFNTNNYVKYMKAYQDFIDDIPETKSYLELDAFKDRDPASYDRITNIQNYTTYSEQMLRVVDYYKRYRDLSYIGIGVWYLVTILDANVDASLFNYDISDNLDVAVMPSQVPLPGGYLGAGVNVSLTVNF
ncbi:MAG TPA: DUF5683 domain-containing protein [Bacteroidales bacterium]|nr:DUF5683 domain-containing protein [Bacteroidales bacterium]